LDVIYELQGRHETQGKHIHDEATIRELRKSPEFAAEYLRAALEDADESRVLLIALARVGRTLLSDVFPL
jgi:DNA-binding phage protein